VPWTSSTFYGTSIVTKPAPEDIRQQPNNPDLYKEAIRIGKQTLGDEGTKAAAARAIFTMLKDESREVVIQAFIEGASITPKGGPTYYYNINRKIQKLRRQ
jgi:hypothetical protein